MIWWRKEDTDRAALRAQDKAAVAEADSAQAHNDLMDAIARLRERLGIPFDEVLTDVGNDLRGRGK